MTTKIAADSGQFDAMAVMPSVVLGPCMATVHELRGSWQWAMARMLEGKPCPRGHVRRKPLVRLVFDAGKFPRKFLISAFGASLCLSDVDGQDRAWNIVDVRDCGEIHALIAESTNTRNGQRYMCSAHDDSGLLNIFQLRAKLKRLFPDINVRSIGGV